MALEVDAVCTGLNLFQPAEFTEAGRTRAREIAKAILASGFPASSYKNKWLKDMARFCRTYQPELFAEKTKSPAGK